jgi:Terminase large subunit, T4likevirus-type, N-terminal
MTSATMRTELRKLQSLLAARRQTSSPVLDQLRKDPATIFTAAGMKPDPWQAELLKSSPPRMLLLCSRQAGKSTTAAALAILAAVLRAPALILLLSPTLRQSGELFKAHVLMQYKALGRPVAVTQESALTMTLANGSRIISLPGEEGSIRSFSSVRLIIVDEAARVPDDLYRAVRPMLAVSKGQLVCLSTPFGKRGFFYDEWTGKNAWKRVQIKATDVPRITAEFLEEERQALGDRWYRQEYLTSFEDVVDAVFSAEDIAAAMDPDLEPWNLGV